MSDRGLAVQLPHVEPLLLVGRLDCGNTPTESVRTTPVSLVPLVALRLGVARSRHNVKGYRTQDDVKGCRTHRSYVRPLLCAHDGILRRRIVILGIEVGLRLLVALYHLEAGVIIRDNSWRIPRSASSRIRELISLSNVHCEIVHWVMLQGELAGWPRQLRSSTGEVAAYLVERRFARLSQREAWVDHSRFGGLERPRVARVGLVLPASLLLYYRRDSCCGTTAAV